MNVNSFIIIHLLTFIWHIIFNHKSYLFLLNSLLADDVLIRHFWFEIQQPLAFLLRFIVCSSGIASSFQAVYYGSVCTRFRQTFWIVLSLRTKHESVTMRLETKQKSKPWKHSGFPHDWKNIPRSKDYLTINYEVKESNLEEI